MHPMYVELEAQRESGTWVSISWIYGPRGEVDGYFRGLGVRKMNDLRWTVVAVRDCERQAHLWIWNLNVPNWQNIPCWKIYWSSLRKKLLSKGPNEMESGLDKGKQCGISWKSLLGTEGGEDWEDCKILKRVGVAPVSTKLVVDCPSVRMGISLCGLRGISGHKGESLLGVTGETKSQAQIPFCILKLGSLKSNVPFLYSIYRCLYQD